MNEIRIKSAEVKKLLGETTRLTYTVEVDNEDFNLWYEVHDKWADCFCPEVADPVVIAALSYAIRGGYDIVSELPVSRRLLFNLRSQVIPQLHLCTKKSFEIDLKAPVFTGQYRPNAAVTAMSMGVDSFTTFFEYTKDCPPEADPITHLVFFENGDHRWGVNGEYAVFLQQKNAVEEFCRKYGWELIVVKSNIDTFLREAFWAEGLVETSTYKHVSTALSLQKLIKTYYYSASYNLDGFSCDLNEDVTDYEKWLLPLISTDSTYFASTNKAMTRAEKTKYISQFPETYDNLLVCCFDGKNCGICNKCVRTEMTLYKLGVLDKYRNSFDLDFFYKNIGGAQKTIMYWKYRSAIDQEVFDMIRDDIPFKVRLEGEIRSSIARNKKMRSIYYKLFKHVPEIYLGELKCNNLPNEENRQ